jgi:inorganic pyrophosphatase
MSNLWKDLDTGVNPPEEVYAVVECVKGERNKYEYDKDISAISLDRVLHSNVHYPGDYGFIPRTWYDDEDPLDVLVLIEDQTFPGCIVNTRPVALMKMNDNGEMDDKVIAVPVEDPRFDHIRDLEDIPNQLQAEINEFFSTYKNLEKDKIVKTLGWENRESAIKAINRGMELYLEKFS